jgi:hypothetical protein
MPIEPDSGKTLSGDKGLYLGSFSKSSSSNSLFIFTCVGSLYLLKTSFTIFGLLGFESCGQDYKTFLIVINGLSLYASVFVASKLFFNEVLLVVFESFASDKYSS